MAGLPENIFPIGTEFPRRGKNRKGQTGKVIDHLTTTNATGDVVQFEYAIEWDAGYQMIADRVVHTTIKMALMS